VDANEDVVRGDADEVVVIDSGAGGVFGDEVLLVDVVCMNNESMLFRSLQSPPGNQVVFSTLSLPTFSSLEGRGWRINGEGKTWRELYS
jgi:hypothetical protein